MQYGTTVTVIMRNILRMIEHCKISCHFPVSFFVYITLNDYNKDRTTPCVIHFMNTIIGLYMECWSISNVQVTSQSAHEIQIYQSRLKLRSRI
jgi:hypothetical protein